MLHKSCLLVLIICSCLLQQSRAQASFNGDLEQVDPKTRLPLGWGFNELNSVHYAYSLDSTAKQQGRYAVSISSLNAEGQFGGIGTFIPYRYEGQVVQLKGYIKTEKVSGYAGFYLQVVGTRAFNNMQDQQIKGTSDWKEYTFTLPYYSENATGLSLGALLSGTGKMWFDHIRVYIDGKPVEKATAKRIEVKGAQKDTAFSENSRIRLSDLTNQQIQNLSLLGQVWGFIKYHHPAVAKGDFNMDAELFRVMPAVINAHDQAEASTAIEHWIDHFGLPEPCHTCKPYQGNDLAQKPDYGQLFDPSVAGLSLVNKLTDILNNHNISKSYYIGMAAGVGNPEFKNELPYSAMVFPDMGYRLLCLFRYWNMVQYFFPYKYMIGRDWNTVLPEYIPQFISAKDATEYDLAVMKLISSIHDTHANIWSRPQGLESYRGPYAPPFQAKFIEGKLVVTAYYNDTLSIKTKIKIGDVINTIDGESVDALIKKYLPITAASNYSTQLRDMPRNYLLRGNKAQFKYGIMRDGKSLTIAVDAINFTDLKFGSINPDPKSPSYRILEGGIAYVYPGNYHNKDLPEIKKLFAGTKGMIIDMRCYPSEFMPFTFVPYIKSGDKPFVKFTTGSISEPGLFRLSAPLIIKGTAEYQGKVIVIVNEESQSQAEYTTMAFQSSPNVTVIGSNTAGADGNVSSITLPGGIRTMISGINVLYPDGTETQRKGVKIDLHIKPTIAGIKAGKDEVLEKAKELILQLPF